MIARNCRPTRQRIRDWLRLGLSPLNMFHNPITRTLETAMRAIDVMISSCITLSTYMERVKIYSGKPDIKADQLRLINTSDTELGKNRFIKAAV